MEDDFGSIKKKKKHSNRSIQTITWRRTRLPLPTLCMVPFPGPQTYKGGSFPGLLPLVGLRGRGESPNWGEGETEFLGPCIAGGARATSHSRKAVLHFYALWTQVEREVVRVAQGTGWLGGCSETHLSLSAGPRLWEGTESP